MIDTDKYEGHLMNKAVEDNSQVWCWQDWMLKNAETIEQHEATAALLNDAPLFLEEIKRLRGLLDIIVDITLKELKIFDDNCPMIKIRDLAYKGILWRNKE